MRDLSKTECIILQMKPINIQVPKKPYDYIDHPQHEKGWVQIQDRLSHKFDIMMTYPFIGYGQKETTLEHDLIQLYCHIIYTTSVFTGCGRINP